MQLTAAQQGRLDRARSYLVESKTNTDSSLYCKYLGGMEVHAESLLELISDLTGDDQ